MSSLYDAERVKRLARIQRSFSSAVRVGDEVAFGLKGDPEFPPEYRSNRPIGKVVRVKGVGTDAAAIRVKLNSGSTVNVMPYSLDPRNVWEFTDEHWPKVKRRFEPDEPETSAVTQSPSYGNSTVPKSEYDALLAKVEMLSSRFDREMAEAKDFNGALVASFSEMADEVRKVSNDDASFCRTFAREYKTMVNQQSPAQPSPYDSDAFSDSE